jgi:hypothetical protein
MSLSDLKLQHDQTSAVLPITQRKCPILPLLLILLVYISTNLKLEERLCPRIQQTRVTEGGNTVSEGDCYRDNTLTLVSVMDGS